MNKKITKVEEKYFVDEQGLYKNLYVDVTMLLPSKVEFINLDFIISPSSGSNPLEGF